MRFVWSWILKAVALLVGALVAFAVVFLLVHFVCSHITVAAERVSRAEIAVFFYSNGVHTDLVLPVHEREMDWSREIKYTNTLAADSAMKYVAFGWGDRDFYIHTPTWADLKLSTACKAAVGLGGSAIHATYYKEMHEGDGCKRLMLSRRQYLKLVEYIQAGFKTDAGGHYILIKTNANYGPNDAFYEACGRYTLFDTCNTWTNGALKACGQKACLWTVFEPELFRQ